mmetsp:Transcript_21379/g.20535  ORF Transcript_21379/g.20535 Transcript_21379/m.20535 type:complete len:213 (-) Transcript_21379:293-931(-)
MNALVKGRFLSKLQLINSGRIQCRKLSSQFSNNVPKKILSKNGLLHSGGFVLTSTFGSTVVTLCDDDKDIISKIKDVVSGEGDFNEHVDKMAREMGAKIQGAVDSGIPTQLSYGFVCGYCSGFALKKVGKVGAVVFGLGFMSLQSLSYAGYIKVDHDRIKNHVETILDLNNDGKVDKEDADQAMGKVMEVLNYNLPAGGGFGAGFIGGIRSG